MNLGIVGGTYIELCQFPAWDAVYGSGLRAVEAVSRLGGSVDFWTYVGSEHEPALLARAHDLRVKVNQFVIPRTVSFEYVHGFSIPVISPLPEILKRERQPAILVEGDAVLRFGLIEGDAKVAGKRVVYDPQNPHEPESFATGGSTAERLAIVCNKSEGSMLTGEKEPSRIAEKLIGLDGSKTVVVKCGSQGAIVAEAGKTERIPAYETKSVWPIGSGDVFAAAFAWWWACNGTSAVEAAHDASKVTAFYCEKQHLDFPANFATTFQNRPLPFHAHPKRKKVYLAGPFFSMGQIWLINEAYDALDSQGLNVFSPLHHVGRGSAEEVYAPDIQGIEECDVVFACVDGLDPGTIFEIGYAKKLNRPVVAFVENEKPEDLKMLIGSGCILHDDFVTAVYKTSWIANAT